jgi:hypothetical protein
MVSAHLGWFLISQHRWSCCHHWRFLGVIVVALLTFPIQAGALPAVIGAYPLSLDPTLTVLVFVPSRVLLLLLLSYVEMIPS